MAFLDKCSRRRKIELPETESEPDRLSELPELLIARILSQLEMKDVVKTGILSKRWKNLWTQADNLVYNFLEIERHGFSSDLEIRRHQFSSDFEIRSQQFTSFIDNTLRRCTGHIKKFHASELFLVPEKGERDVMYYKIGRAHV